MYEWELSEDRTKKRAINKKKKKIKCGTKKQEVLIRKNAKSAWIPVKANMPETSWIEDTVCVEGTISIGEETIVRGKGVIRDVELKMCFIYGTGYSISKTVVQDICTLFLKDGATISYSTISNAVTISGAPEIVNSKISLGTEILGFPSIRDAYLENNTVVKDTAIIDGKIRVISSTITDSSKILSDDSIIRHTSIKDNTIISGEKIHIENSVLTGEAKVYSFATIKNSSIMMAINEHVFLFPINVLNASISSPFDLFNFRFNKNRILVYRTIDNTFKFCFEDKQYDEWEIENKIHDIAQQTEYDGKGPGCFCWAFWCQNQETLKKYCEEQVLSVVKTFRAKTCFSEEDVEILLMLAMWSVLEFMCFLRSYTMDNEHYLIGWKKEGKAKELGSLLVKDLVVNIKTKDIDVINTSLFLKKKTVEFLAEKTGLSQDDVLNLLSETTQVVCTDFN